MTYLDRSTHELPDRESKNLPDSHLYPHSCKDSCQEKQCLCTVEAVVQGYMVEPKNNKNINKLGLSCAKLSFQVLHIASLFTQSQP